MTEGSTVGTVLVCAATMPVLLTRQAQPQLQAAPRLQLRRLVADRRPDVVHTSLFHADVLGRIAAIGRSTRVLTNLVRKSLDGADAEAHLFRVHEVEVDQPLQRVAQRRDFLLRV